MTDRHAEALLGTVEDLARHQAEGELFQQVLAAAALDACIDTGSDAANSTTR